MRDTRAPREAPQHSGPALRVRTERRLLYLCPDYDVPAGGVRVIYRHVEILRTHGYDAHVVHEREGFRCTWFPSDAPVLAWTRRLHGRDAAALQRARRHLRRGLRGVPADRLFLHLHEPPAIPIGSGDILVVPEIFGPRLAEIEPGVPKVIFNQNAYFTFKGYPADPLGVAPPYAHGDVVAILAISEDSRSLLEYAFPGATVRRVRWSLDPTQFRIHGNKTRRISYMPRRGAADALHVLTTLAARGALDAYEIVPIEDVDEANVASELRRSLIFLSLGYHEGLPRPPAEAMACGAIVVGYDGFGGSEYMLPEFAFPVPAADLRAFANTLEHVLRLNENDPRHLEKRARRASEFVMTRYAPEAEENELLAAWDEILESLP